MQPDMPSVSYFISFWSNPALLIHFADVGVPLKTFKRNFRSHKLLHRFDSILPSQ